MFNSYTDMLDLVKEGLAVSREKDNLVLFKYSRKAFHSGALAKDSRLLECRGHVYDKTTGSIVQTPFRKSFGYLENNWWREAKPDDIVSVYTKHNGFMAAVTDYQGDILVTTTGSFDSPFVELAKKHLGPIILNADHRDHLVTILYEICSPEDPHIVDEKPGAVFLGSRFKNGAFFPSYNTFLGNFKFKDALKLAETATNEGFMVYHTNDKTHSSPCKVKTQVYVVKKLLMRAGQERLERILSGNSVHKKYLPLLDHVRKNKDDFHSMEEQVRRKFLEDFLKTID